MVTYRALLRAAPQIAPPFMASSDSRTYSRECSDAIAPKRCCYGFTSMLKVALAFITVLVVVEAHEAFSYSLLLTRIDPLQQLSLSDYGTDPSSVRDIAEFLGFIRRVSHGEDWVTVTSR